MTIARQTWSFDNGDGVSWIAAPTYDDARAQARVRGWGNAPWSDHAQPALDEADTTRTLDQQPHLIDVVFP